jgi:hypothetical protein
MLQQLLATTNLEKERRIEGGPSIIPGKEVESAHPIFT